MTLQEAIEGVERMIKDAEEIHNAHPDHKMLINPMRDRIKFLGDVKLMLLMEDKENAT